MVHADVPQLYYGKARCYPGCIRWRPDVCRSRNRHVPVFPGIEKTTTGENLGDIGVNRGARVNRAHPGHVHPGQILQAGRLHFITVESRFVPE